MITEDSHKLKKKNAEECQMTTETYNVTPEQKN